MHASEADAIHSLNGLDHVGSAAQLDLGFAERRMSVLDRTGVDDVVLPTTIVKRDGRITTFDPGRIERAIGRCFAALGREPYTPIPELALRVINIMSARPHQLTVEVVQDAVELTLQAAGEFEAAKAYILYRADHAKQRQERPVPDDVRAAFAEADQYFPTPIQKFQFFDKYSRFDYEKGRRETWIETVDRAVSFLHELVQTNTGADLGSELYERLRRMILDMKSLPSMRLLAMAGAPARRDSTAIYNCSYLPVDSVDAFCEALLISMAGCGVGYSVESRYVENFPRVQRQRGGAALRHTVEDSAQGWAAAVRLGIQVWFEGGDIQFNFDEIRAAGAPLRTKGGRASGPGPLHTMLEFTRGRVLARQGMHLRPIDAHDIMCMVGNAAVSGGVRRTAMISLFDYDDLDMRLCKSGDFERDNSQRWNANNSAVWPERGLDQVQVIEQVLDMVKSQRGEPGIFNRKATLELIPEYRKHFDYQEYGTNPCVTGETWVAVADGRGRVRMDELAAAGKDVDVYSVSNSELVVRTMRHPRRTGTAVPIVRVRFTDGTSIRVTRNHKFVLTNGAQVEAAALRPNDALSSMSSYSYHKRGVPKTKKVDYDSAGSYRMLQFGREVHQSEHRFLFRRANLSSAVSGLANGRAKDLTNEQLEVHLESFVRGLGYMPSHPEYVAEARKITDLPVVFHDGRTWVIRSCERCRTRLELPLSLREGAYCRSCAQKEYHHRHGSQGRVISLHDGHQRKRTQVQEQQTSLYNDLLFQLGRHPTKQEWQAHCRQASVSAEISRNSSPFRSWQDLQTAALGVNHRVVNVEEDGTEDVFTGTVDDTHTYFAIGTERLDRQGRSEMAYVLNAQCGEIILRKNQFCNLSIAVARSADTYATLKEKIEVATIIGTIQSLATNFVDLRPIWKQNCEEERLLGVDITGQMDSPIVWEPSVMQALRTVAIETNRAFAAKLGINPSAAVTTVKPSGNSSQLLNCSSGLHSRWAPYYERNVRVATTSPIFKVLRDAGVPMDPENGQTREDANTWVVHFPMKSPDGAITRTNRSAIEQCNYWLHNKVNWTDHNPSVTILYKPNEVIDLTQWIWEHRDLIGGMAFLPSFDAHYAQLPYIEISKEDYERRIAEFPEIDYSKLWRHESTDLTSAAQELACLAGVCEIDS